MAITALDEDQLTVERVKSCLLECELKIHGSSRNSNHNKNCETSVSFSSYKQPFNPNNTCFFCHKKDQNTDNWPKKKSKFHKNQSYNSESDQRSSSNQSTSSSKQFAMTTNKSSEIYQPRYKAVVDSSCTEHVIYDRGVTNDFKYVVECKISIAKAGESRRWTL